MSIFPDIIKIKITNIETGKPVPNIAVFIKLFARRKNDYSFVLDVSDEKGQIVITRSWLINEIDAERNLFIMDYASTLEDCYPKFELRILDKEAVARAIKAMNLFKSALGTKQEEIDRLSQVDNPKYKPVSTIIELHGEKVIEAELRAEKA